MPRLAEKLIALGIASHEASGHPLSELIPEGRAYDVDDQLARYDRT